MASLKLFKKPLQLLCLKSLVTIRMNEIFPCLACYGQKINFLVRKSRQRLTQAL